MDKESCKMEPRPQHQAPDKQTSGTTKKEMEDEINDFLKPEKTETTKGNEMKNNDIWIKVAKRRERWIAMEGGEYAKTAAAGASMDSVHSRENPRPIRPARYQNGVRLDDDEVANII